jgi:hypothetical protein
MKIKLQKCGYRYVNFGVAAFHALYAAMLFGG